ncbi:MAG: hypothetical protein KAJ22_03390, partial [Candidatus Izimaplasma sp.]|nr:hypothetical protein [Candidatus Izimaplasma bacterium]
IGAIIANHVVAIDDIDGDLSNQVVIVTDAYTTNEQTVGDYDVVLSVSDSSGNEAFFTLTILVKDEIAPVIIGPDIVDISVDEITIIDGIIANNFSMLDEYDNILNDYVVVDNYTANKRILGEYLVSFSVEDDSLNVASKTFTVNVVDITNPVMVGDNIYNSYLSSPLYLSDVLDSVSFTDNYYDLSGVDPTIVVDNFSLNELVPGTYNINIEMEDGSNNVLSETLTINVIDDVAPIISGPVSYSGSYNNALLVSDFVAMLNVSDNVDALTTDNIYVISDNYSNRVSEVGNYIIVFGIIDINNNEDIHQLDITLFDDVAPVIYVDNYIVTVNLSATFNENDALKLLLNSNELANDNYTIITLIDEYKGNEKTPGAYIYRLSFTNENGEVFEKEFLVKVADTDGLNISKDLLPRNIAIYSSIFGYSVFILLKRRKIVI